MCEIDFVDDDPVVGSRARLIDHSGGDEDWVCLCAGMRNVRFRPVGCCIYYVVDTVCGRR